MLKITTLQDDGSDVLLKLEGKIVAQWADLLDGVCRIHLQSRNSVHLDCAGVDFIDARGIAVINGFPNNKVTLTSAPEFVAAVLQSGGRS